MSFPDGTDARQRNAWPKPISPPLKRPFQPSLPPFPLTYAAKLFVSSWYPPLFDCIVMFAVS